MDGADDCSGIEKLSRLSAGNVFSPHTDSIDRALPVYDEERVPHETGLSREGSAAGPYTDGTSVHNRPPLHLVIYQPWLYLHGGLERSLLELVTRSRHNWTIYTGHYDAEGTFPGFAALDVRPLRKISVDRRIISVFVCAARVAMQKLPLASKTDAVVVCCDGIGDMLAFRNHSLPMFNLCLTPLRAAFDPWYEMEALRHRTWFQRLLYAGFKLAFRYVDRLAWRYYRGVVAISGEVQKRILAGRLCTNDRIVLAHPGVDWSPELPDIRYEPFILVSGRIMWTKNIELAIRAFKLAQLAEPWSLVIAGFVDQKSKPYLAKLQALASSANVRFIVSPTDAEMRDLFRRASICLFTPLNEDWGIVPLEAMAYAKPVIAVNAGGPLETIEDGESGYLLPPVDVVWAARIAALIADPSLVRQLGSQARKRVERFTWTKFVANVDDALESWMGRDPT